MENIDLKCFLSFKMELSTEIKALCVWYRRVKYRMKTSVKINVTFKHCIDFILNILWQCPFTPNKSILFILLEQLFFVNNIKNVLQKPDCYHVAFSIDLPVNFNLFIVVSQHKKSITAGCRNQLLQDVESGI